MLRGAFGLVVEGFDDPTMGRLTRHPGRVVRICLQEAGSVKPSETEGWSAVAREMHSEGGLSWGCDVHPEEGWFLWGDHFGEFLVEPSLDSVRCAPVRDDHEGWRVLLVAQVLPFVALLHGLEPFHASAVLMDAGVVAFTGLSGSGKSTLAARGVADGGMLMADDVLTTEVANERVIAHPGAAVLKVRRPTQDGSESFTATRGTEPAPIAGFCLIDRAGTENAGQPAGVLVTAASPRVLLASSFNYMYVPPARLIRQFELCARLADQAPVLRVTVGHGVDDDAVMSAIRAGLEAATA